MNRSERRRKKFARTREAVLPEKSATPARVPRWRGVMLITVAIGACAAVGATAYSALTIA